MKTPERAALILKLTESLVRYRMDDTAGLLTADDIASRTTDRDIAFALKFIREAAPLYGAEIPAGPNFVDMD